jgi:hypothetical protein
MLRAFEAFCGEICSILHHTGQMEGLFASANRTFNFIQGMDDLIAHTTFNLCTYEEASDVKPIKK